MPTLNSQSAVYVGSFDPLTLGHLDIIQRAARLFEHLTVGIGINPDKTPLFTPEERLAMAREVLQSIRNVSIQTFSGLTVDFVRQCGAGVMVRGIRTLSDIEAEFTMTLANRALDSEIETVFLMAGERFSHISSSLIKQIARMSQNSDSAKLGEFVPAEVIPHLLDRCRSEARAEGRK